jgi:hypothetical protein
MGRGEFQPVTAAGTVTVRAATREDADTVERIAGLDSVHLPPGPMLVAEVDHEVRAALSLTDQTVVADPFHPTSGLVELLREHATGLFH